MAGCFIWAEDYSVQICLKKFAIQCRKKLIYNAVPNGFMSDNFLLPPG